MVAVAPATVGDVTNDDDENAVPVPSATERSSTTSSAASTRDPPLRTSLKSAVTVTGVSTLAGSGAAVTLADVGPTWSPLDSGGFVSRNVSMPPKACCGLTPPTTAPERRPAVFGFPPGPLSGKRPPPGPPGAPP